MKINHFIFVIFLTLHSLHIFSQAIKTKIIIDSKTRLPIEYVYANSDTKKETAVSDKEGKIDLIRDAEIKAYTFYKIGYGQQTFLTRDLFKSDTIILVEKPYELGEVEITVKALEEIIKDKRFYLDDYIVLTNADFLIITTIINSKEFTVAYYKRGRGITCTKKFKGEFDERLFKDCFKNYQLITNAYSRQFTFPTDSTFDFLPSYSRDNFDATLAGIILRIDSHLIAKTSSPPESFNGSYYSTKNYSPFLTYKLIYRQKLTDFYTVVYNEKMREMIQSELDDYKNIQQSGTKQSAESIAARHSFFFGRIVKPLYAPIFVKNDTVVLFNFQEDEIVYLNKFGYTLGTIKMEKFSKYHDFEAFYDEVKQNFYIKCTKRRARRTTPKKPKCATSLF